MLSLRMLSDTSETLLLPISHRQPTGPVPGEAASAEIGADDMDAEGRCLDTPEAEEGRSPGDDCETDRVEPCRTGCNVE